MSFINSQTTHFYQVMGVIQEGRGLIMGSWQQEEFVKVAEEKDLIGSWERQALWLNEKEVLLVLKTPHLVRYYHQIY